jgi:hypothetical protein
MTKAIYTKTQQYSKPFQQLAKLILTKPTDNRAFFDETDVKLVVSFATETVFYQTGNWLKSAQNVTLGLLSVEVSLSFQNYAMIGEDKYARTLNRDYSAMTYEATEQSQGSERDCNEGISTLAKGSASVRSKNQKDTKTIAAHETQQTISEGHKIVAPNRERMAYRTGKYRGSKKT